MIPPKASAAFVAAMEDVLAVYTRPHDPARPLVCLDETSKQLVGETRPAVPMAPGRPAGHDYAYMLKDLSDVHFADAEKIILVQDNLNTHVPASLYEAFPPVDARRLAERFEWHYTPKHGSWLNPGSSPGQAMAEAELAVLAGQCLNRRIPDPKALDREVSAWQTTRNSHNAKADWRFTTDNARIKLKTLYPAI